MVFMAFNPIGNHRAKINVCTVLHFTTNGLQKQVLLSSSSFPESHLRANEGYLEMLNFIVL